jgi:ribosome-associated protein
VSDGYLRVSRGCTIPLSELEWRFSASGGPGGQHANTSNTKAEVRFDVERSEALGPRQRARIRARWGPVVRAVASERRSQAQNRDLALDRLRERIASALRVQRARVPTSVTPAAKRARLEEKRRQARRKEARRRVERDHE